MRSLLALSATLFVATIALAGDKESPKNRATIKPVSADVVVDQPTSIAMDVTDPSNVVGSCSSCQSSLLSRICPIAFSGSMKWTKRLATVS